MRGINTYRWAVLYFLNVPASWCPTLLPVNCEPNADESGEENRFFVRPMDWPFIIGKFGPFIYRTTRSRWRWSHEDAEDHVQNVFLRLLVTEDTFSSSAGLNAWFRTVSFQLAADEYRKAKKSLKNGSKFKRAPLTDYCEVRPRSCPIEEVDYKESFELASRRFSPGCGEILAMRADGFSTVVIAARLGLTQRMIQRKICSAWNQLRVVLHPPER